MKEILFDSNKCIWQRDFGYDSMSLSEFDEYVGMAAMFIGHFVDSKTENLSIDMNRLNKTFRMMVFRLIDNKTPVYNRELYYQNKNVKWMDNFFGVLNNEYGLAANNLRIPKYPTSSADGYYQWWVLYKQFRNFKMDFEHQGFNDILVTYQKIVNLKDKYFYCFEYRA